MVNSKNLLTAGVMSLAVASIVTYMQVNNLTTEDITLVDACYKASQASGINVETCDEFKEHSVEWDTKIPCIKFFQEEVYYYTPRMMFAYFSGGKAAIANLGRKNKGESTIIYSPAKNISFIEALNDRCDAATTDPSYPVWKDIHAQFNSGVAVDDIDFSKYEDRELYGWNTVVSWIESRVTNTGNAVKDTISAFKYAFPRWTQVLGDAANYKACSLGLALKSAYPGIQDRAECSGKHPTRCRKGGGGYGPTGWWDSHHRHWKNRLNNGCNTHDKCLQVEQAGDEDADVYAGCDISLSMAATKCMLWKNPGWSCGWRGCRSWWFSWKYSCSDSRVVSASTAISMATTPNGP